MEHPVQNTPPLVKLHPDDNVFVALRELSCGESVDGLVVSQDIPQAHKVAAEPLVQGDAVIKFGAPIGKASSAIQPGEHVHSQNLRTALETDTIANFEQSYRRPQQNAREISCSVFASDGNFSAAIRNEIWIVNTVACVNQTATRLAQMAENELVNQQTSIDAVLAFPHPYGCSQLGDDLDNTQKILAGLISHSHAAGVLVLGLGCENNRIQEQIDRLDPTIRSRVMFFNTQDVGDELESGMEAIRHLAEKARERQRVQRNASEIILGMKCGGSDGLSGITANPLLGRIADLHCSNGGTVLLTEVPEMFGAENFLLGRCSDEATHSGLLNMINQFKDYFRQHDQPISENPSPGNRDGGITTLEEKSLGCVQKAGSQAAVKQILEYGEPAQPGLGGIALVNSPGNDGVSTTALTVAGANIILFTTGRGTPLGAPVPTIKVSTNSALAKAKPSWIDFDAGRLIDEPTSFESLTKELYQQILATAEGIQKTKNELNGFREIAIWKTGVTL